MEWEKKVPRVFTYKCATDFSSNFQRASTVFN